MIIASRSNQLIRLHSIISLSQHNNTIGRLCIINNCAFYTEVKIPIKYKYLGIIIDKNLSWSSHIEYISGKISKVCEALAKLRYSMSTNLLIFDIKSRDSIKKEAKMFNSYSPQLPVRFFGNNFVCCSKILNKASF